MALDETRETFGIERCIENRERITEVWFRPDHGEIGGNATKSITEVRERTASALIWH